MTKKQRMNEIKEEIKWYEVKKSIADAMLRLGEVGFEFSGHGCGMGGEDFNLCTKDRYVNFCDQGRKVKVSIYTMDDDMETLFHGTIGKALKFLLPTE